MHNTGAQEYTLADGRGLAANMLRELEAMKNAEGIYACWIGEEYRQPAVPQNNIVARYLAAVRETGCPDLEVGFTQVLTDFIACTIDGTIPSAAAYEAP